MALKWLSNSSEAAMLFDVDIPITANGQDTITWNTPYIMGINMLEVHLNGELLQKGSFSELTPYSISYTDASRPLQAGDIINISYRTNGVNLGNIRVVADYGALLNMPNPIFNEVALVKNNKTFFLYGANGWEEFAIPFTTVNVGVLFQHETVPVTDTTVRQYAMTNISYQPGMQNLLVFVDGELVDPSRYTEVDNKTIVFGADLPTGSSSIEFIVADTDSWEDCFSHTVDYVYVNGNIQQEIIKMNGTIVKQTDFGYDTEGNISRETVVKGIKTIIKDYTYDLYGNIEKITVTVVK